MYISIFWYIPWRCLPVYFLLVHLHLSTCVGWDVKHYTIQYNSLVNWVYWLCWTCKPVIITRAMLCISSVGIDLKELEGGGVSCRNVRNFAQGFKADFHSKMGVCTHELGGFTPPPPTIPTLCISAVFAVDRCLSVCLSVTLRCCIQMAKLVKISQLKHSSFRKLIGVKKFQRHHP